MLNIHRQQILHLELIKTIATLALTRSYSLHNTEMHIELYQPHKTLGLQLTIILIID